MKTVNDKIIAKRLNEEKITSGGVHLLETSSTQKDEYEVVKVGRGRVLDNGSYLKMQVKIGDKFITQFPGTEVKIKGNKYFILNECDILVIL